MDGIESAFGISAAVIEREVGEEVLWSLSE